MTSYLIEQERERVEGMRRTACVAQGRASFVWADATSRIDQVCRDDAYAGARRAFDAYLAADQALRAAIAEDEALRAQVAELTRERDECKRFIGDVHKALDNPYVDIQMLPTFIAAEVEMGKEYREIIDESAAAGEKAERERDEARAERDARPAIAREDAAVFLRYHAIPLGHQHIDAACRPVLGPNRVFAALRAHAEGGER